MGARQCYSIAMVRPAGVAEDTVLSNRIGLYEEAGCAFTLTRHSGALFTRTPSEHSSGGSIRRGGITKTGNKEARGMIKAFDEARSCAFDPRVQD
ncbi:transposase [Celeribacter marinus]|uniref:transposase n=1 Tax=Celeribacter marinus TaxID=1397108 RepID=UPI003F6B8697